MNLGSNGRGLAAVAALSLALPPKVGAVDGEWPKEIDVSEGRIVIYQPQPETLEGDVLEGRAAVSVTPAGKTEPVFGVIWFESQVEIDRNERMVHVLSNKITDARVTEASEAAHRKLAEILTREVGDLQLALAYDRLLPSLEAAEAERSGSADLATNPPKILIEHSPAILVVIQGNPELREVGESGLMKVVNTPFFIVLDPSTKRYWLNGGTQWFEASEATGEYTVGSAPSEVVAAYKKQLASEGTIESEPEETADHRTPKIVVATEPSELIVMDGEPKMSAIVGDDLLYVKNTEDDVFMEAATQQYYVVLSGRWYRSSSLSGPWEFVRSDALGESFAKIPEKSDKGHVLTFVAGTAQAEDAVMDAQIPQTAVIRRSEATLAVTYDGEPEFKQIPNTGASYALNTKDAVLLVGSRYYCCKDGVWFESTGANGPWLVADSVPDEIKDIPPDNPHYNVKYVEVYDSTPDVVYVGYTPGYYGCYPYYGTVFWGTGFDYPPYVGPRICSPYHSTWGFHVNYNPWTGWSSGMSWSTGWAHFAVGFGGGYPCWGPAGYAWRGNSNYVNGPVVIHRPVNIQTGGVSIGNKVTVGAGNRSNFNNVYARGENKKAVVDRGTYEKSRTASMPYLRPSNQKNDVIAGKDGRVYKRDSGGRIQQHDGSKWKSTGMSTRGGVAPMPATRPSQPSQPSTRPATIPSASPRESVIGRPNVSKESAETLSRQYQARDRGAAKTQDFQNRGSSGRPPGSR